MAKRTAPSKDSRHRGWTYLTNHALVIVCLAEDPYIRLLDIAEKVGITDRAVQKILSDLESDGAIERTKEGRCNRYTVNTAQHMRHAVEGDGTVGDLLARVTGVSGPGVGLGRDG